MTATTTSRREASPEHGPALGRSRDWLGRFHVTGVFWYRFHYWAVATMPVWVQNIGIAVFTTVFFLCLGRIRSAIASNLEPVLGPAGAVTRWRRSYRTLYEFADCLTERYRRLAKPEAVQMKVDGEAHWRDATSDGRGAILVTAHVGPWEVGVQLGAAHQRRIVHIVREGEIDPRAQKFIENVLQDSDPHCVTHFASDDPRLGLELAEALRRGELVALQGDRPRAGGRVVFSQVFGQPMPLPIGPAALARASGVPLLPIFNFREGRAALRTVIRPAIQLARTANRDDDVRAAVDRLAQEIEWAIAQHPHQWFCFRKLWD